MNEEDNGFDRKKDESRDASELHSFGGMKDESPEETPKSENEELADAIEELESDEVENSMPEDKVEEPVEEPAEEKPAFKMDDEPVEEPKKEEPIMTIDSVKEPKAKSEAKGGTGWKVATFLFAALAILGCGAASYLFFVNGTTKFLGREISSKEAKTAVPNAPSAPSDAVIDSETAGRYIYLDGYDLAIKIPDDLVSVSYEYSQYNMGDPNSSTFEGNYSTLTVLAATNRKDAQSVAEFIENKQPNEYFLGALTIGRINPLFAEDNLLGEPFMKTDDGYSIWFEHPQGVISGNEEAAKWEEESAEAISKWLKDKTNYIKLK